MHLDPSRRVRLATALAAATAALLAFAGTAGAAIVINTTEDLAPPPTVVNPCDGELVVLTGTFHLVVAQTFADDGKIFTHTQLNYQNVRGFAPLTGTNYQANQTTS